MERIFSPKTKVQSNEVNKTICMDRKFQKSNIQHLAKVDNGPQFVNYTIEQEQLQYKGMLIRYNKMQIMDRLKDNQQISAEKRAELARLWSYYPGTSDFNYVFDKNITNSFTKVLSPCYSETDSDNNVNSIYLFKDLPYGPQNQPLSPLESSFEISPAIKKSIKSVIQEGCYTVNDECSKNLYFTEDKMNSLHKCDLIQGQILHSTPVVGDKEQDNKNDRATLSFTPKVDNICYDTYEEKVRTTPHMMPTKTLSPDLSKLNFKTNARSLSECSLETNWEEDPFMEMHSMLGYNPWSSNSASKQSRSLTSSTSTDNPPIFDTSLSENTNEKLSNSWITSNYTSSTEDMILNRRVPFLKLNRLSTYMRPRLPYMYVGSARLRCKQNVLNTSFET